MFSKIKQTIGSSRTHVAILFLLIVLVYANSIPNYLNGDDDVLLTNVPAVHGLSLQNIKVIFTSVPNSVEYLPIRDLSYCIDYELWGLHPFGYHFSNVVYYSAACIFLYLFLARLFSLWSENAQTIAFLSAVIFALHPVHVESVAGIAQRKDVLSGLFFFASLWTYMIYKDTRQRRIFVLSVLLACLALLSKHTAVVLPGIVLLIDYFTATDGKTTFKEYALHCLPYLGLAILISAVNYIVIRNAGIILSGSTVARIPTALRAIFKYVSMLFVPYPLKTHYEFRVSGSLLDPMGLFALFGLSIMIICIIKYRQQTPVLSFSGAWFLMSVPPVIGLIPASTIVAERYLFIPSVGFGIAAAWLLMKLLHKKFFPFLAVLITALVVAYSSIVVQRNFEWKNIIRLWSAEIKHNPDSSVVNRIYGRVLFDNRQYTQGLIYMLKARELDPNDNNYDYFRALYAYKSGDGNGALSILRNFGYDHFMDVQYLYGLIFESFGDYSKARHYYEKALKSRVTISAFYKRDVKTSLERINLLQPATYAGEKKGG